jgi:hypothetical protein
MAQTTSSPCVLQEPDDKQQTLRVSYRSQMTETTNSSRVVQLAALRHGGSVHQSFMTQIIPAEVRK